MKKLRIILLVILVLIVGLPPLFGMLTESAVRARVDSMRDEGPLQVTVEEYDRGWFASRALLSIAPGTAGGTAGETLLEDLVEPMRVTVDFTHGPAAVQDGLFLGFTDMRARPAGTATGPTAIDFDFRAQTTFGGNLNFVGEIMPFDAATDGGEVRFSGGRVRGTLAGEQIEAWLDIDTLQYARAALTVSLLGVHASMDHERVSQYVRPGVMTLAVDRMSVDLGTGADSTILDMRALGVDASTALDDARAHLSGAVRLAIDRLLVGRETEVTNVLLDAAAEQLEVNAFEAYMRAARHAADNDAANGDQVEPAVLRLLEGGPTLSIDALRFAVDGEPVEASAQATVDGSALPSAGAASLRDIGLWMAVLDGQAEIAAAKSLAEQAAMAFARSQLRGRMMAGEALSPEAIDDMARAQAGIAIALLAAQGLLEDTGSLYRTALRLEDGRLTINGQGLPFFGGLP